MLSTCSSNVSLSACSSGSRRRHRSTPFRGISCRSHGQCRSTARLTADVSSTFPQLDLGNLAFA
eukprot:4207064-Amphidinium_carterae.1